MTRLAAILSLFLSLHLASPTKAGEPVVIELFTSQGCSSCPPADGLLEKLAARDDVIALALHVDYWDYIGWKDSFANPLYTDRQKGYARAAGARTIYTPQMVIAGQDHVVGYKPMEVADLIAAHKAQPRLVDLTIARDGDGVVVTASSGASFPHGLIVSLVHFNPSETVDIKRGENAGKTIAYHNIVTDIEAMDSWDGSAPYEARFDTKNDGPAVVLLQKPNHGSIVAAAALK